VFGTNGRFKGKLGEPLLTHLVETFARYSGLSIEVEAEGDEKHHVNEDIALTIGRALRRALPDSGVRRFGEATVPMDEVLVQVAVDLIDRPYYSSDLSNSLMAEHVLRSLVTEARITFHQRTLRPGEEHHVLEATFKAFGLALASALEPSSRGFSLKGKVDWQESY
jgi:imidazoleglycerol-phosphate dehydratase